MILLMSCRGLKLGPVFSVPTVAGFSATAAAVPLASALTLTMLLQGRTGTQRGPADLEEVAERPSLALMAIL